MIPQIHSSCYIDETAVIIGDVIIEEGCSVWPHAVIRGDLNRILIREGANVQDNCVIHVTREEDTIIGKDTTLGHGCVVHGSHIDDNCIIGMNSCVLDGSRIGKNSIVGAGAVVTAGTNAGSGSLLVGMPAKVVKESDAFAKICAKNAKSYHRERDRFRNSPPERYRP
jgi:carbonic anhydrase/acetyltransferase-like protein (isoleucine patch superfamily)